MKKRFEAKVALDLIKATYQEVLQISNRNDRGKALFKVG